MNADLRESTENDLEKDYSALLKMQFSKNHGKYEKK